MQDTRTNNAISVHNTSMENGNKTYVSLICKNVKYYLEHS